jgi:Stage II sporulation protein E (SpoIIE)
MTVSLLVGAIRAAAEGSTSPGELLANLIRRLHGRGTGFTTCLILHLTTDGNLIAANAGHLQPYLDGHELALEPGLPLGFIPDATYPESHLALAPTKLSPSSPTASSKPHPPPKNSSASTAPNPSATDRTRHCCSSYRLRRPGPAGRRHHRPHPPSPSRLTGTHSAQADSCEIANARTSRLVRACYWPNPLPGESIGRFVLVSRGIITNEAGVAQW